MDDVRTLAAANRRRQSARLWVARHRLTTAAGRAGAAFDRLGATARTTATAADDLVITMEVAQLWETA